MGTYDLSMDEKQKIATIKMEGLPIDVTTIMRKICPIVEDYGMRYIENTVNTPNYNSAADIMAKGTDKYYEDRKKNGNQLILTFVPDDRNMSSEAFHDIVGLIGKKVVKKAGQLAKQQIMHS